MTGLEQCSVISKLPEALKNPKNVVLIVGDLKRWETEGRLKPTLDGFAFVGIQDLKAEFFDGSAPEIVLSALVADSFDAIDVVTILKSVGFQGRYRAIVPLLPNAKLVSDEVRSFAPGIDFDLLLLSDVAVQS